jgi:hypothetical protein
MDDVETIRAWQRVEVALAQGANGGPRKRVIKWLNRRQAAIEGRDGSAERTEPEYTDASSRDETTEPVDEPVTPTPSNEVNTEPALAADGGAPPPETPICPECRGELKREEIADTIGYWCSHCGGFREPIATEPRT